MLPFETDADALMLFDRNGRLRTRSPSWRTFRSRAKQTSSSVKSVRSRLYECYLLRIVGLLMSKIFVLILLCAPFLHLTSILSAEYQKAGVMESTKDDGHAGDKFTLDEDF